jgi:ABC-type phosphate/phosphonate transport system substrate-binding protein
LVARAADQDKTLADFRGRVLAYNSTDSQSGYNSLRALVAPLAVNGDFFSASQASGGHRQSVDLVRQGLADLASVDCVTWAGLQKYSPETCEGLVVVGQTEAYPGLPLITSLQTPAATVAVMRQVFTQAVQDPALRALRQALFIEDFVALEPAHYQVCLAMREQAQALGCTSL